MKICIKTNRIKSHLTVIAIKTVVTIKMSKEVYKNEKD